MDRENDADVAAYWGKKRENDADVAAYWGKVKREQ